MRRLLKKEVSLDTYTWQKKYGHLTSSVMMAQVDERLKRRFSVSASMEEISKIAEMKTLQSQTSLGPEQAALAQSQHFDQLEALWNKRSPPRRRNNAVSTKKKLLRHIHVCHEFIHFFCCPVFFLTYARHSHCHDKRLWLKIELTIPTKMSSKRNDQVCVKNGIIIRAHYDALHHIM